MSLQIIYGRAGSGKTTACMELARELLARGGKVIYLAPEQITMQSEALFARSFDAVTAASVDVLSFLRLAGRVFDQYGPLYQSFLDAGGKQMLAQRLMMRHRKELTVLEGAAQRADFASSLVTLFTELQRYAVTPEELLSRADSISGDALKLKLRDLSLLYRSFLEEIPETMSDSDRHLDILCEKIDRHGLFTDTHFILDGFTDFTRQEEEVIRRLLAAAPSVTVTLTTDDLHETDAFDLFAKPKRTARSLMEAALELGTEVLPNRFLPTVHRFADRPELAFMERYLMQEGQEQYKDPTHDIELYTASNPLGEITYIAEEILRLCRKEGLRFRDFSVVARDITGYGPILRQVFTRYGIACRMTEPISLAAHPLGAACTSLLKAAAHDYATPPLFSWLKSGFADLPEEAVMQLENYVLAAGGARLWKRDSWQFAPKGYSKAQLEYINKTRQRVAEPFQTFYAAFHGRKTVRQITEAFYRLLTDFGIERRILHRKDALLRTAWDALCGHMDKLCDFLGDEKITLEDYLPLFTNAMREVSLGSVPDSADQVQICSADRFWSGGGRILFLLGCNDGELPAAYTQEGLLTDAERDKLADTGLSLAENAGRRQAGENLLFYRTLCSVTDRLYLSYHIAGMDGKAAFPSLFLRRIRKRFPSLTERNNIYLQTEEAPEGLLPSFYRLLPHLRDEEPEEMWQQIQGWYIENEPELWKKAQELLQYSGTPGSLTPETVRLLYGEHPHASISRAEQFARCQYAYFLQYGLHAEERPELKLTAPDAGTLLHRVIELFFDETKQEEWKELTEKTCREKADILTDRAAKEVFGDDLEGTPSLARAIRRIRSIMAATLWQITRYYQKTPFINLGSELTFEEGGDCEPIRLTLSDGSEVVVRGKIDRADLYPSGDNSFITIVDYKSSQKDIDFGDVLAGVQLQLPVYLQALCSGYRGKGTAIPAAIYYYHIHEPLISAEKSIPDDTLREELRKQLRMRGLTLDEAPLSGSQTMFCVPTSVSAKQLKALCDCAYEKLKSAFEGIRRGEISANPYRRDQKKTACDWCPYHAICGFDAADPAYTYRDTAAMKKEEFFAYVEKMDRGTTGSDQP